LADKIKIHRNQTKRANHARKQTKNINNTSGIKLEEDELR
jgi:hypothetical protein